MSGPATRTVRARPATDEDRAAFDAFVASSPLADPLQSWAWGEVKRASGWRPVRIVVEEGDRIVAACSMLLQRPARGVPPIAYCPRGPVLDYEDERVLTQTLRAVRAASNGAFAFICDPPVERGSAAASALRAAGATAVDSGGFGGLQPKAVMVLDLAGTIEEIAAGLKPKWRYNIRLAERKGVAVRAGTREDLDPFYEILKETARRDRFLVRGRDYFRTLWDRLEPEGMLRLFVAEYQGRPIAGAMLLRAGGRAVYTYGASSNEHRNVMPNHLVQWRCIEWAKQTGHHAYDFRGVSPVRDGAPVEAHLAGLNRFKEGFGARYVEYAGQFDWPLRRGWYALWRAAGPRAIALAKRVRRRAGEPAG